MVADNTRMAGRLACFIAAACLASVDLAGRQPAPAEWVQWRGANRDGISQETGLLQEWPKSGPPLVWRITGVGNGYSSFAASGGRLYTLGARAGRLMRCSHPTKPLVTTGRGSSNVYLIDTRGLLRGMMPYGRAPDDCAHDVRVLLAE